MTDISTKLPAKRPAKKMHVLTDPVTVPEDFERPAKKLEPRRKDVAPKVTGDELLSGPEIVQLKKRLRVLSVQKNMMLATFKQWHHHVKANPNTCACGRNPCSQLKAIDEAEAV